MVKLFKYGCLVCIGVGIVFRFLLLNMPFEYDELFTAITSNPNLEVSWIWTNWLLPDVHPPLYNILLWVYNHWVPYGPEVWLRLPSVVFFLVAMYIGWRMFPRRFGAAARLLFLALIATHSFGIFYSQHARSYALIILFSIPLTFLFLEISKSLCKGYHISWKKWAWWGMLSFLLSWSHYFGALFFFVTTLLLVFQGIYYRRKIGAPVGIAAAIFLVFMVWLIPNFEYNLMANRFAGNWWANQEIWYNIPSNFISFFFGPPYLSVIVCGLLLAGWMLIYQDIKLHGYFPYQREWVLLLFLCGGMIAIVSVLHFKINLWISRYFFSMMPALYLFCTLSMMRIIRRNKAGTLICLIYIVCSLVFAGCSNFPFIQQTSFSSRQMAQFYKLHAPDKELFVIAIEAFPPQSMNAIYSFYPNQIYKMNAKVTELYQLDENERNKILERRDRALIIMPNCNEIKLSHLSYSWQRNITIVGTVGTNCVLQLSDKQPARKDQSNYSLILDFNLKEQLENAKELTL